MSKYIEADKLAESLEAIAHSDLRPDSYFSGGFREGLRKAAHMLREEPSADVAPVVHAEWSKNNDAIVCSSCGFGMFPIFAWSKRGKHKRDTFKPRFCPDCGAKMDVETP